MRGGAPPAKAAFDSVRSMFGDLIKVPHSVPPRAEVGRAIPSVFPKANGNLS